jgi:hypothetical protein
VWTLSLIFTLFDWQIRFRVRTPALFGSNQPGSNMFVVRPKKLTPPLPLQCDR